MDTNDKPISVTKDKVLKLIYYYCQHFHTDKHNNWFNAIETQFNARTRDDYIIDMDRLLEKTFPDLKYFVSFVFLVF